MTIFSDPMLMRYFFSGAIILGFGVVTLFFFRFWRRTRDRLFGTFSLAFGALIIERLLLVSISITNESRSYIYIVRLLAFALIAFAIIDKNRKSQ